MLGAIAKRLFGSANDRYVKTLQPLVDKINALEPEFEALSDDALKAQTTKFRERLDKGEKLDNLLPEAFATVREASKRTLGLRHFDVQLLGGIVLHKGMISEMKTGEGKTLVATLAVYLNALEGKGVHVVTVNDYLARRDSEWMGQIYNFLGLSVGCVVPGLDNMGRKVAYACDVTYGTNNELGFDYLRDNMKFRLEDMAQRDFNFAIVDEVDSILVDEARTPLIISGPAEDASDLYRNANTLIPQLEADKDYEKDEKARSVTFTEEGQERMEALLQEAGLIEEGSLFDIQNISLLHHANQALKAHTLFQRDKDYIVKDDKVVIIDEFTGRMMEGRRYSEGLHQALEAKEGVTIQQENQTLASITFQNYFRLYPKLAGMTGTAMTEADEFQEIYSLEVVEIPTNEAVARVDHHDEVYRTAREKYDAIVELIKDAQERKQPVLVGTVSIEKSEMLSDHLKKEKVKHNVLNARYHEQEASIIAQAGVPGAVTIATNMAGRGTDIQLGGNLDMRLQQELEGIEDDAKRAAKTKEIEAEIAAQREVVRNAGGLYVVGTERHESRRIDNQLRGRSGRQGDPGASKFFLSLEDDLMRVFGSDRMDGMLQKLGLQEGEPIVHPWVNKALEKAQQKVEARNFEIRKNLLKFDDVMNDQRKVVFEQRREFMQAESVQGDLDGLHVEVRRLLGRDLPVQDWGKEEGIAEPEILERLVKAGDTRMAEKAANFGPNIMRMAEKSILLQILDQQWKEHLLALDHLRHGIGLRAYGQRDPLNEYKREAFDLFHNMLATMRSNVTSVLSHLEIRQPDEPETLAPREREQVMHEGREDPAMADAAGESLQADNAGPAGSEGPAVTVTTRQAAGTIDPNNPDTWGRVSRNAACPCGSGRKYKHCHGKL